MMDVRERGKRGERTRIVKTGKKSGMLNGSIFQYWIARLSSNWPSLAFAATDQGGLFPSYPDINQHSFLCLSISMECIGLSWMGTGAIHDSAQEDGVRPIYR